jgi:hypothetical protein
MSPPVAAQRTKSLETGAWGVGHRATVVLDKRKERGFTAGAGCSAPWQRSPCMPLMSANSCSNLPRRPVSRSKYTLTVCATLMRVSYGRRESTSASSPGSWGTSRPPPPRSSSTTSFARSSWIRSKPGSGSSERQSQWEGARGTARQGC